MTLSLWPVRVCSCVCVCAHTCSTLRSPTSCIHGEMLAIAYSFELKLDVVQLTGCVSWLKYACARHICVRVKRTHTLDDAKTGCLVRWTDAIQFFCAVLVGFDQNTRPSCLALPTRRSRANSEHQSGPKHIAHVQCAALASQSIHQNPKTGYLHHDEHRLTSHRRIDTNNIQRQVGQVWLRRNQSRCAECSHARD